MSHSSNAHLAGLASDLLAGLWSHAQLDAAALTRAALPGEEPVLPSSLPLGSALQAALAAAALAGSEVLRARDGLVLPVSVDLQDVLRESACRFTLDGQTPSMWDKLSGLYRCADEPRTDGGDARRWVRVHANFAHHRDGVLSLLRLPTGEKTERAAVEAALRGWRAEAFEAAAAEQGLVVAAVRRPEDWAAHPQAAAVAAEPLVSIERAGDAPPRPWPRAHGLARTGAAKPQQTRPLAGLRVLELTRILAGPVAGRTLAAQGADVLLVNGPHLPNIEALAETSRGKRSAHLDLRTPVGREQLQALAAGCDVFLQGYRPGGLADRGFGAADLERLCPGIVTVSLSAYGSRGPWAGRRGFDSLVQSATGLNLSEAAAFGQTEPRALPLQALDYGAGYLLAFGALAGLLHQRTQGGSWRVQVSLAGVGRWLNSLPRVADPTSAPPPDFGDAFEDSSSGFGLLRAVRHSVVMDGSRLGWSLPSMPPGSHAPQWADGSLPAISPGEGCVHRP